MYPYTNIENNIPTPFLVIMILFLLTLSPFYYIYSKIKKNICKS